MSRKKASSSRAEVVASRGGGSTMWDLNGTEVDTVIASVESETPRASRGTGRGSGSGATRGLAVVVVTRRRMAPAMAGTGAAETARFVLVGEEEGRRPPAAWNGKELSVARCNVHGAPKSPGFAGGFRGFRVVSRWFGV